ncbi:MAG: redoxin family protein [Phycisphaerae bacterium]
MIDKKWIFVLPIFILSSVLSGQTSPATQKISPVEPQFDPRAAQILKQTLEKYQKCGTYHDQSQLTIYSKSGDRQNKKSFNSELIFQRPNKILFTWPLISLTCNGKQYQADYPDVRQYTVQKAPSAIDQAFWSEVTLGDFMPLALTGLISENPYKTAVSAMDNLKYGGLIEKEGKSYHQINYTAGPDQVTVLINPKTMLISQIAVLPQKAKSAGWQLQMTYQKVIVNEPIADSVFKITPPAEARKVDRISFTRQYDYPKLGQMFPPTSLDILGTTQKSSVDKLLGSRLTFVVFWATWCPACREQIPELQKLYLQYKSKGFQVVGINLDQEDATEEVKSFIKEGNLTFPNLFGRDAKLAEDMEITSEPSVLILDGRGVITQMHVGFSQDTVNEFRWTIEKKISGDAATKPVE